MRFINDGYVGSDFEVTDCGSIYALLTRRFDWKKTSQTVRQERKRAYGNKIEAHSRNRWYRGKTIRITYSECVSIFALVKLMHRVVICDLSDCITFFHTISQAIKKKLLNTKYIFLFSLEILSETFLNLRRIHRHINHKFT